MAAVKGISAITVFSFCGFDVREYIHFCKILNGGDKSEALVRMTGNVLVIR